MAFLGCSTVPAPMSLSTEFLEGHEIHPDQGRIPFGINAALCTEQL